MNAEQVAALPHIASEGIFFGEGPRWHDGRLWYSDFYGHCVRALAPDDSDEVVLRIDGQPSGLGWLPDGQLLIVSMLDHRILRRAPDGSLAVHADVGAFARHRSNDMLVDPAGRAYVGNFGFDPEAAPPADNAPVPTSLTRVDPDGSVSRAASDLLFPNGMALSPDGATMIVAETFGGRLTAFDVDPDGTLSGRRVWADLRGTGIYPDGICLDAGGAAWVAAAAQPLCVRVGEGGQIIERAQLSQNCYACELGGPDRRTLYAMTAPTSAEAVASQAPRGRVERMRVRVPGADRP
jgi:sugar lactone lactonase YvrE